MNIRSVDEAIVIGAALSLSSSAFVLQVGTSDITSISFYLQHISSVVFI